MAFVRAALLFACVLAFFVIAVPAQALFRLSGRPAPAAVPRLFCATMLALLGVRVGIVGTPGRNGRGGRLIVANHVSWIDILVLGSQESPSFLAKREVASWPFVSAFAEVQDTIFVDRRRKRLLPQANRAMAERLGRGRSVLLFPEGTTHDGTRRGRFLTSHLACLRDLFALRYDLPSCAVQAVALAYSDPIAAWIGDATLLPHLWAVLNRPPMVCTLCYGEQQMIERGYDRKALGRALALEIDAFLEGESRASALPRPTASDPSVSPLPLQA